MESFKTAIYENLNYLQQDQVDLFLQAEELYANRNFSEAFALYHQVPEDFPTIPLIRINKMRIGAAAEKSNEEITYIKQLTEITTKELYIFNKPFLNEFYKAFRGKFEIKYFLIRVFYVNFATGLCHQMLNFVQNAENLEKKINLIKGVKNCSNLLRLLSSILLITR